MLTFYFSGWFFMDWVELKDKIYYCDDTLRDLYIFDTNI